MSSSTNTSPTTSPKHDAEGRPTLSNYSSGQAMSSQYSETDGPSTKNGKLEHKDEPTSPDVQSDDNEWLEEEDNGPSPEEIAEQERIRAELLQNCVPSASVIEEQGSKFAKKNLEFGGMLGEGAYAKVFHCRLKTTSEEYAVKMMEKKHIVRYKKELFVVNENAVLAKLDHPNLMRMHMAYQDNIAICKDF
jgi:hypothetical protein